MGSFSRQSKTIALFAAPVLALLLYWVLPDAYVNGAGASVPVSHAAKACLAILLWMALWWFTETVPIAVTALLPIILYPLCEVTTLAKTLTPYASDTIYLFLGGFLLAAGIQRWGLDKRIALKTMQIVGTSPGAIIAGVMIATGFISMWVSNTATAAMMVPIAIAVMSVVRQNSDSPTITKGERNFGICVLLAVAYGASIGGMGTIIGSPPNGIFVRFVQQTYGVDVSIVQWMKVGMPVVLLLMPLSWLLLTKVLFREQIQKIAGGREWIRTELKNIGKPTRGEISVLIVFICAVVLWCLGSQIRSFTLENGVRPFRMVSDAVIAMAAGVSLFCIPVNFPRGERALDWKHCDNIPWDVLLLFGRRPFYGSLYSGNRRCQPHRSPGNIFRWSAACARDLGGRNFSDLRNGIHFEHCFGCYDASASGCCSSCSRYSDGASALSDDYWCFCRLHDAGCDTAECDYFRYRPHPDRRND